MTATTQHPHLQASCPPYPLQVRIPLDPTPSQAAAYRTVLTRSYELLADARPSRHAGYRAAQMRNVCLELRKVCCGVHVGCRQGAVLAVQHIPLLNWWFLHSTMAYVGAGH